jgi:hypothetical protein
MLFIGQPPSTSEESMFQPVNSTESESSEPPTRPITPTLKNTSTTSSDTSYLIETSISDDGSTSSYNSTSSTSSASRLWKKAACLMKSRLEPELLRVESLKKDKESKGAAAQINKGKREINDFDVLNCINVIKDIAIDLQQCKRERERGGGVEGGGRGGGGIEVLTEGREREWMRSTTHLKSLNPTTRLKPHPQNPPTPLLATHP